MQILLNSNPCAMYDHSRGYLHLRKINFHVKKLSGKWVDVNTDTLFRNAYSINTELGPCKINDSYVLAVRDDVRAGKCVCPNCGRTVQNAGMLCPKCDMYTIQLSENNCFRLMYPNESKRIKFDFGKPFLPKKNLSVIIDYSTINVCNRRSRRSILLKIYDRKLYDFDNGFTFKEVTLEYLENLLGQKNGELAWNFIHKIIDTYSHTNESNEEEEM